MRCDIATRELFTLPAELYRLACPIHPEIFADAAHRVATAHDKGIEPGFGNDVDLARAAPLPRMNLG
jgi:hypothetical protein